MELHRGCTERCTDTECNQCLTYFYPTVNGKCTWNSAPTLSFELIGFGEFSLNGLAFSFKVYISVKTGILFNAKLQITLKITSKNRNRFLQEEIISMICDQDGVSTGSISDNSKGSDYLSKFYCSFTLNENSRSDVQFNIETLEVIEANEESVSKNVEADDSVLYTDISSQISNEIETKYNSMNSLYYFT